MQNMVSNYWTVSESNNSTEANAQNGNEICQPQRVISQCDNFCASQSMIPSIQLEFLSISDEITWEKPSSTEVQATSDVKIWAVDTQPLYEQ